MIVFRVILDAGMNISVVTRNWEKRGPHRPYEDMIDEKSGGEKSSSAL
ncbi:hypothetical protein [Sutcliffiella horikoshii]|nr:hypothetical protein [Sutcliffiella horikoshii]